jgi:Ca-activated chloride channel homolog
MALLLEALILPLFAAALAYGQFTSGVNLVEVYATVTDAAGAPVTGLTAADFHVSEDGAPQAIAAFTAGEFPLAIAVGVDRSFSMTAGGRDRLAAEKAATRALIEDLRPGDQVMVLAIGSETTVAAPLGSDRRAALRAVDALDVWGTTPLYDATVAALDAIQPAKGRRALVLLSDGFDRDSRTSAADLIEAARRHDVLVYPIAIGDARPPLFAELAAATGGRSVFVRNAGHELGDQMHSIARELRFQYLLGYAARPGGAAGWHAIDVTVDRPVVRIRARGGYFSR